MDLNTNHSARNMNSGTSRRGLLITLGASLLIVALISYSLRAIRAGSLYSSPTAIRDTNTLFRLQKPPETKPETDWTVFEQMAVSNAPDGSQITVRYTNDWSQDHGLRNYERHELAHDDVLEVEGGRIQLQRIAVGYGPPPEDQDVQWGYRVEPQVFHGDFTPYTEEELAQAYDNKWQRQLDVDGGFPTVRLEVAVEGLGELKNLGAQFIDATTGQSINSGYSYGDRDQIVFVEADIETWRAHPLLFVIDIAHGPTVVEEYPAEPGVQIPTQSTDLMLLTISEGDSGESGSRSNGNSQEIYWKFREPDEADEKTSTAIFLGFPTANPIPAEFEFLNREGEVLSGGSGGSSSRSKYTEIRDHLPEDIETIRVTQYQRIRRLVFHLPYIPGLPNENQEIDNLFDLKIPYVNLDSEWRLREALSGAIQMSLPWSNGATTNAPVYPIILTNTSPRELLPYWERQINAAGPIVIDPETGNLVVAQPLWQRLRQRLERLFQ